MNTVKCCKRKPSACKDEYGYGSCSIPMTIQRCLLIYYEEDASFALRHSATARTSALRASCCSCSFASTASKRSCTACRRLCMRVPSSVASDCAPGPSSEPQPCRQAGRHIMHAWWATVGDLPSSETGDKNALSHYLYAWLMDKGSGQMRTAGWPCTDPPSSTTPQIK